MITINRIRLQGTESINLTQDTVWRGRSGESLWMAQDGVKTIRVGEDLVLWIPSDSLNDQGQPVLIRLQVTGFFKLDAYTQVIIVPIHSDANA